MVILQETMSNLVWLISVNMPVTFAMFIATYFDNLFMMNGGGEVPLVVLVAIGMSFAFLVAKILLIWVKISKSVAYGLAGSAAILAIVLLMPLAFYNLDILAGGRSITGKTILSLYGFVSGYFFGASLSSKVES